MTEPIPTTPPMTVREALAIVRRVRQLDEAREAVPADDSRLYKTAIRRLGGPPLHVADVLRVVALLDAEVAATPKPHAEGIVAYVRGFAEEEVRTQGERLRSEELDFAGCADAGTRRDFAEQVLSLLDTAAATAGPLLTPPTPPAPAPDGFTAEKAVIAELQEQLKDQRRVMLAACYGTKPAMQVLREWARRAMKTATRSDLAELPRVVQEDIQDLRTIEAAVTSTPPRYRDGFVVGASGTLEPHSERDWYPWSVGADAWAYATNHVRAMRAHDGLLALADEYTRLTGAPPPFLVPVGARIFAPTVDRTAPRKRVPGYRPRIHPDELRDIAETLAREDPTRGQGWAFGEAWGMPLHQIVPPGAARDFFEQRLPGVPFHALAPNPQRMPWMRSEVGKVVVEPRTAISMGASTLDAAADAMIALKLAGVGLPKKESKS